MLGLRRKVSLFARALKGVIFSIFAISGALNAQAANVIPDAIFGGGNDNGDFTVDQGSGVELGLRGKLRFDSANNPQNIFNYNSIDTYTFSAGTPPTGFSFAPNSPTTPIWNFEWSINSNFDGSGVNLDDLTYLLEMDFDPGAGTTFQSFDPINVPNGAPVPDHSIGNNLTGNGLGAEATDATDYVNLIAANNVAQNSWSYEFFNNGPFSGFDPFDPGTYTIRLSAFDGNNTLASTSINILVTPVPVPAALPLLGSVIGFFGFMSWRRKRLRLVAGWPAEQANPTT